VVGLSLKKRCKTGKNGRGEQPFDNKRDIGKSRGGGSSVLQTNGLTQQVKVKGGVRTSVRENKFRNGGPLGEKKQSSVLFAAPGNTLE